MPLPKNEKKQVIEEVKHLRVWVYAPPFSGKTTFADSMPNNLMFNTDGNTAFLKSPFIDVRDKVKTLSTGKISTDYGWALFQTSIDELAKEGRASGYEGITIDLLEGMYSLCRTKVLHDNGAKHESEGSYGSLYSAIDDEFWRETNRLLSMDFNLILCSHEDSSRDLQLGSEKSTVFVPNLKDKVARLISGRVDITCRIDPDNHKLKFAHGKNVFGGNRIKAGSMDTCDNDWNTLVKYVNSKMVEVKK